MLWILRELFIILSKSTDITCAPFVRYKCLSPNTTFEVKPSNFSVSQIEYPLGGSNKTGSCHGTTIVTSDCTIVTSGHHFSIIPTYLCQTIVLPRKFVTGSIHD